MNTQVGSDSRPIAARTRSNTSTGISGATASDFCNRRCTLEGLSPLSPSSSNSSNPSLSYETEFPYHSPGEDQGMAHDQPPLGQDRLYQILGLMNKQIERVQGQVAGNATCNSLPSSSISIRQNNARGADRYNITLLNQDQSSSLFTSIRALYSLLRLYNLSLTHSRLLFARKELVFYNNASHFS